LAKRPTLNAEKTSGKRGRGGSSDCLIVVSHANARERTDGERVVYEVPVGPPVDEERDGDRDQREHEQRAPAAAVQHQPTTSS
jgi:hypothetical protein